MATKTKSTTAIEAKFRDYLVAWNSHDMDEFMKYWADDFHCHFPACPPVHGKEGVRQLLTTALSVYVETLHPTWLSFSDRTVAMEAKGHIEMQQDLPIPFPFDGKTYKKGDKFVYALMYVTAPSSYHFCLRKILTMTQKSVHYEYDDDLLIKTFRSFGQVLNPDPGEGVQPNVLPGYDPLPEITTK